MIVDALSMSHKLRTYKERENPTLNNKERNKGKTHIIFIYNVNIMYFFNFQFSFRNIQCI